MCWPPSRSMLGLLTAVQAVTLSSPPPGLSGYSTRFDAGGALASIRRSSAAAVAAALSDGKELLEIEFPPLIESKGQFDDFSNVEVLDANRDFGVQLALEPEIQAPAAPPSTHTPLPLASSSPRGPYHAAARISAEAAAAHVTTAARAGPSCPRCTSAPLQAAASKAELWLCFADEGEAQLAREAWPGAMRRGTHDTRRSRSRSLLGTLL